MKKGIIRPCLYEAYRLNFTIIYFGRTSSVQQHLHRYPLWTRYGKKSRFSVFCGLWQSFCSSCITPAYFTYGCCSFTADPSSYISSTILFLNLKIQVVSGLPLCIGGHKVVQANGSNGTEDGEDKKDGKCLVLVTQPVPV